MVAIPVASTVLLFMEHICVLYCTETLVLLRSSVVTDASYTCGERSVMYKCTELLNHNGVHLELM